MASEQTLDVGAISPPPPPRPPATRAEELDAVIKANGHRWEYAQGGPYQLLGKQPARTETFVVAVARSALGIAAYYDLEWGDAAAGGLEVRYTRRSRRSRWHTVDERLYPVEPAKAAR